MCICKRCFPLPGRSTSPKFRPIGRQRDFASSMRPILRGIVQATNRLSINRSNRPGHPPSSSPCPRAFHGAVKRSDNRGDVRLPRTTGSPCPAGFTTMPLQAADGHLPQATPSRCPMRFGLLRILVQIEPGHAGCALWRAGLLDVRQHAEEPSAGPLDHPEDWRVLLGQRSPTLCPIDHSRRRLRCRAGRRPGHDRRNHDPIRKSRRSCTRRSAGLTGRSNGGKKGLSASLGRERAFSPITTGPRPR